MSEIDEPEGGVGETRTMAVNLRRRDIATGLDREHIDEAIKEWRDIGHDAFHEKYETQRAYKFEIVESDGAKFDAKAILFGARRRNGLDGRNSDFRGDEKSVAEPLMALGYTIEEVQNVDDFTLDWDVPIGARMTRDERRERFGGALYGGIEPSAKTPNVFVYSDPERGSAFGYNFDGWNEEGDCFLYTGEGRVGPQTLTDGNKALLNHVDDGRAVRLFVEDGHVPDSDTKIHRYIGEFKVDPALPFVWERAPDQKQALRPVIVFRLLPLESESVRPQTRSTRPEVGLPQSTQVSLEAVNQEFAQRKGVDAVRIERSESQLVERLVSFLSERGCTLSRWRLRPMGEKSILFSDPFWQEGNELFEAKSSAHRDSIRAAIGQLWDYKRLIGDEDLQLTVVVPGKPNDDLLALCDYAGVGCVYETKLNVFERHRGRAQADEA